MKPIHGRRGKRGVTPAKVWLQNLPPGYSTAVERSILEPVEVPRYRRGAWELRIRVSGWLRYSTVDSNVNQVFGTAVSLQVTNVICRHSIMSLFEITTFAFCLVKGFTTSVSFDV